MKLLAGLSAALLAFVVFDASLWRKAGELRAQNQRLLERVAALELARDTPAVAPGATQVAAMDIAATVQPAPAAAGGADTGGDNAFLSGMRQALDTPEGREFTRVMLRMSLAEEHSGLAGQLGISQEKADQLLDLLARHMLEEGMDQESRRRAGTTDPAARDQQARELAERQQAQQAEIAELLGSHHEKWQDYERDTTARRQETLQRRAREQLREVVSTRGNPLGEARFSDFAAAVEAEQKRMDQQPRSPQQQMQDLPERNRRLLDVAAGHLDPAQLERYRRHLEQEAQMMRVMTGAMGAAQGQ